MRGGVASLQSKNGKKLSIDFANGKAVEHVFLKHALLSVLPMYVEIQLNMWESMPWTGKFTTELQIKIVRCSVVHF